MAYAFVQSASTLNDASLTSLGVAFPTNVGSGSRLIVVAVATFTASDTITISDAFGTTYHQDVHFNDATNGLDLEIWSGVAPASGGASVVTATFNPASTFNRLAIHEYLGNVVPTPFDVSGQSTSVLTTVPETTVITTTSNGGLIFCAAQQISPANSQYTAGTNEAFTIREMRGSTGTDFVTEDAIKPVAGTTFGSFLAFQRTYDIAVATYKAAIAPDDDPWTVAIVQPQLTTVSVW